MPTSRQFHVAVTCHHSGNNIYLFGLASFNFSAVAVAKPASNPFPRASSVLPSPLMATEAKNTDSTPQSSEMDPRIEGLFKTLDVDNKGYITTVELERVMPGASEEELHQVLAQLDNSGSGQISFDDFKQNFAEAFSESFMNGGGEEIVVEEEEDLDFDDQSTHGEARPRSNSVPREEERRSSETYVVANEFNERRSSMGTVGAHDYDEDDNSHLDDPRPEGGNFVVDFREGSNLGNSHERVGELMQRNQMLESKMKQYERENKRKADLANALENQADVISKKDDEIARLKKLAKELEERMQNLARAATETEEKNRELAQTLNEKQDVEANMENTLKETEAELKRVLERRKEDGRKQKELEEKASLAEADAEASRKALLKAKEEAIAAAEAEKKKWRLEAEAKGVREQVTVKIPEGEIAPTTAKPNPPPTQGGESIDEMMPKTAGVIMVKDINTGKMVPFNHAIAQVERALVLGGHKEKNKEKDNKNMPKTWEDDESERSSSVVQEKGKGKSLWASEDPTLTVMPATHLTFNSLHTKKPGKVVVVGRRTSFGCTFRNTHRIGLRMNGNGAFFHVYMDGKLSKGFATSRSPADYELYSGISARQHELLVQRSVQSEVKTGNVEVFGVIVETSGIIVKKTMIHRTSTPPPRISTSKSKKSRSWANLPHVVTVEMDKSALGIHHKRMIITKLSSRGQAAKRGVKIGWKLTHVDGVAVSDTRSLKRALEVARKKEKFLVTFKTPIRSRGRRGREPLSPASRFRESVISRLSNFFRPKSPRRSTRRPGNSTRSDPLMSRILRLTPRSLKRLSKSKAKMFGSSSFSAQNSRRRAQQTGSAYKMQREKKKAPAKKRASSPSSKSKRRRPVIFSNSPERDPDGL
ncbi:hypothetical protein AAMO2058_000976000 [Amorphochlora amoebiformis]